MSGARIFSFAGVSMVRTNLILAILLLTVAQSGTAAATQPSDDKLERALKSLDAETIRDIESDICFPATSQEYAALGKHAILMLKSSSAISTELPLRSVYALHKGVRIQLQKIIVLEKHQDDPSSKASQVSFYLIPISLMKGDTQLLADFNGERKAFGFMTFSSKAGLGPGTPAFARLDEYDTPFEPDMSVIQDVLVREYSAYFR